MLRRRGVGGETGALRALSTLRGVGLNRVPHGCAGPRGFDTLISFPFGGAGECERSEGDVRPVRGLYGVKGIRWIGVAV